MHAWQAKREQKSPAASSSPSLLPPPSSAPYDDLAVPSSARTCCRPSVRPSHLRRLGQWRRRGRRAAANGSARRAQNEGSRVKTNDFYSGNQSEEERPRAAAAAARTDDGRWRRLPREQPAATPGSQITSGVMKPPFPSLSRYNTSRALR